METHPSYPVLSSLIAKYPRASGSLFQTYNDIVYAQRWNDVKIIDLPQCSRGAISGRRPNFVRPHFIVWLWNTKTPSYFQQETAFVVPCSLSETLSFAWLQDAFSQLFPDSPNDPTNESSTPFLFVAITSPDASIVYYKLSKGIVKPPV